MKKSLTITLSLMLAGVVFGTLGSSSLRLMSGISGFWPAIVVEVTGGVWFGAWGGLVAAALFPMISNALSFGTAATVIGWIPANIAQGMIPAWAFRHYRADPRIPGFHGFCFYMLWGAIAPSLVGALLSTSSLALFGQIRWGQMPYVAIEWFALTALVSALLGVPALRVITPVCQDFGLIVRGYWGLTERAAGTEPRDRVPPWQWLRDMPIRLKLLLALAIVGIGPLLLMAAAEIAKTGGVPPAAFNRCAFFISLALFLALIAVGVVSRFVLGPLHELHEGVEKLLRGKRVRLASARQDEVGKLAQAFDALIAQRDEFLSLAAHELYTPVTSLQLSIQSVLRSSRAGRTPDLRTLERHLDLLQRQGERLGRRVRELVDVSRLDDRALVGERTTIDLTALIRDVVARFEHELTAARCPVTLDGAAPVVGSWDATRVEQVVASLLSNAAKFGAGRPIEVSVQHDGRCVRVAIRDHGMGIAPAEAARIFGVYERGVPSTMYGGLGLGLFLSRRIIEEHGGSIQVESTLGDGAKFTVELPLWPPVTAPAPRGGSR